MIRHDMTVDQGATFTTSFTWQDAEGAGIDLTSYTARLQVRTTTYADEDAGDPIIELTDEAGITLDAEGVILIGMTAVCWESEHEPADVRDVPRRPANMVVLGVADEPVVYGGPVTSRVAGGVGVASAYSLVAGELSEYGVGGVGVGVLVGERRQPAQHLRGVHHAHCYAGGCWCVWASDRSVRGHRRDGEAGVLGPVVSDRSGGWRSGGHVHWRGVRDLVRYPLSD